MPISKTAFARRPEEESFADSEVAQTDGEHVGSPTEALLARGPHNGSVEPAEEQLEKVELLVPMAIPGAPKGLAVGSHPLPFWRKVALYVVGFLFILLGIAGIFLPILQGVLFILIGAAVLSVASERVYDWMHRLLHRRPKIWDRVHRFRARVHEKLSPKIRHTDDD